MDQAAQLNSLQRQEDESNRVLWLALPITKEFLDKLKLQRSKVQDIIECLSESSSCNPEIVIKLAREARTIQKVINYARTGKYND